MELPDWNGVAKSCFQRFEAKNKPGTDPKEQASFSSSWLKFGGGGHSCCKVVVSFYLGVSPYNEAQQFARARRAPRGPPPAIVQNQQQETTTPHKHSSALTCRKCAAPALATKEQHTHTHTYTTHATQAHHTNMHQH